MRSWWRHLPLEGPIIAGQAFSVVTSILVARQLGASVRGDLTAALVWSQFIAFFCVASFDKALIVHGAAVGEATTAFLAFSRRLGGISVVSAVVVAAALAPVFKLRDPLEWGLFAVASGGAAASELVIGWVLARRGMAAWMSVRIVQPAILLMAAGAGFLLKGISVAPGPTAILLAGLAVSYWLPAAVVARMQGFWQASGVSLTRSEKRSFLRNAMMTQAGSLLQYLNARLDVLLLSALAVSASTIGIYAVALSVPQLFVLMGSGGAVRGLVGHSRRVHIPALLAVCSLSAISWIFAREIVSSIFGHNFIAAADPMRVLLIGAIGAFVTQSYNGLFVGAGRARHYAAVQAFGVIVFLAILAVRGTGLQDYAWASAWSSWGAALLAICLARRQRAPAVPVPKGRASPRSPQGGANT